ncbi:MAG: hypothetical protein II670_02005, partial [Alphaproteobacteria bacterium]|nr:hypothetical protein [Alphaproteobacteria bacterium]
MANLIINGDNNVVVSGNNNVIVSSSTTETNESGFTPIRQLKYLITHYDGMGDVAITPICPTLEMAVNFAKRYVQDDFDYTKGQIKEFKDTLLKNECYEDDNQNVFYPRLVEVSFIPRPI